MQAGAENPSPTEGWSLLTALAWVLSRDPAKVRKIQVLWAEKTAHQLLNDQAELRPAEAFEMLRSRLVAGEIAATGYSPRWREKRAIEARWWEAASPAAGTVELLIARRWDGLHPFKDFSFDPSDIMKSFPPDGGGGAATDTSSPAVPPIASPSSPQGLVKALTPAEDSIAAAIAAEWPEGLPAFGKIGARDNAIYKVMKRQGYALQQPDRVTFRRYFNKIGATRKA